MTSLSFPLDLIELEIMLRDGPPSSSPSSCLSNLLLSYSMWMRMVVEWNGMPPMAENKQPLSSKNRREPDSHKEKREQGAVEARMAVRPRQRGRATPPRAVLNTTGSPWWWLSQSVSFFLSAAFWCMSLVRGFCLDLLPWAYWASFATFLDPFGLNFIILTYYFCLLYTSPSPRD